MITLSVQSDRPVDPLTVDVLTVIAQVAVRLGIGYFVCGAMARDILLFHIHGFDIDRATKDIDIAVAVNTWKEFATLKAALIETGAFTPAPEDVNRLWHRASGRSAGYPIDIIPFGGIADATGRIAWPPHQESQLNVLGCDEALASLVPVEITHGVRIPLVSLSGLALLKLLAWADRGGTTSKDALDLAKLLRCYADAGNTTRLYDDPAAVLEAVDYDIVLAGARLLGIDVGRLARLQTRAALLTLLQADESRYRLAGQMVPALRTAANALAEAETLLEQFRQGFVEATSAAPTAV